MQISVIIYIEIKNTSKIKKGDDYFEKKDSGTAIVRI